jgi:hypothetical protein
VTAPRSDAPSDADQALAAAFVLGELAEPERGAFEHRLAGDPVLAAHVESLMATEELVRRHARRADAVGPPQRARLRALPLLVAAAAVVVAIVGGALLLRTKTTRADDAQVALCPSFESAAEWIARVPELAGQKPPGLDELRGPGEAANVDPITFVETARRAELRALDETGAAQATAPFFSIALRLAADSDVVVVAFPEQGSAQTLWPEAGGSWRVPAGERVLPAPSFRHVEDEHGSRVEYRRGFLVPIGAEQVTVVVGTRSAREPAPDAALLVPSATAAAHVAKLEAAGFDVRTFQVIEPR